MRVCLVLEGSYPYVHGGVSTWTHNFILQSPDVEFVLWTIGAKSEDRGRFVYDLPKNVVEVHELFLDDALRAGEAGQGSSRRLDGTEREAVAQLISCASPDWDVLRGMVWKDPASPAGALMSRDFLEVLTELCRESFPHVPFVQAFYTVRSMALPVLYLLAQEVPGADLYHAISTGYAGLIASMASRSTGRPLILTEHGIYSREREEEIIRAEWVQPYFKRLWIRFFYMLSSACYERAAAITSLFANARQAQIELGADPERCEVISNGVHFERFSKVPAKEPDGWVDIGAPIRIAPIKDVKTMIYAFYELSCHVENVRLHILGSVDDEEYARECHQLIERLGIETILFPGQVDMVEYMAKFDFTILSSISEGQPLSILESFSAGRPVVTTDVGCCRDLVEGTADDDLGEAGLVVAPMDHEEFAKAMQTLCENRDLREKMGRVGKERAGRWYRQETMMEKYHDLYGRVMRKRGD